MKLTTLLKQLEERAPRSLAAKWDNSGLQIGNPAQDIKRVLCSLDVTPNIVAEAKRQKAQLIYTHHPFFFDPIKSINQSTWHGQLTYQLIKENIALYCAHTNLDIASSGLNYRFAKLLDLATFDFLPSNNDAVPLPLVVGYCQKPTPLYAVLEHLKSLFQLPTIAYNGQLNNLVTKVGLSTGSGRSMIPKARSANCDVLITGDLGFHDFQLAERVQMALIEIPHFICESFILRKVIADYAIELEPEFIWTATHADPISWF